MATVKKAPTLSDQDLAELISLTKGADSVELKLTVPVSDRSRGAAALGVDPLDAEIRQVYFFDTPELTLNKAGVVVRARRVQQKGDDTVVKLRPVVPAELPAVLRRSPNFGVEVDAMPSGFVCSGSMKRALKTADVRDTVFGKQPIRRLYSKEQRASEVSTSPASRRPRPRRRSSTSRNGSGQAAIEWLGRPTAQVRRMLHATLGRP